MTMSQHKSSSQVVMAAFVLVAAACGRQTLGEGGAAQDGPPALLVLLDQSTSSHNTPAQRCAEAATELQAFLSGPGSHGADVAVLGTLADGSVADLVPWRRLTPSLSGPYALEQSQDWRSVAAAELRKACAKKAGSVDQSAIYLGVQHAATTLLGYCENRAASGDKCETSMLSIHSDGMETGHSTLALALRTASAPTVEPLNMQGIGRLTWCGLGQGDGVPLTTRKKAKQRSQAKPLPADHVQQVWRQVLGRPVVWESVCLHDPSLPESNALAAAPQ